MRIKRVSKTSTLKQFEPALIKDIIPKYLAKSKCTDTLEEIIMDMRLSCGSPFAFICMILDDAGKLIGFLVSHLAISCKGRQAVVDHFHAPNAGISVKVLDMIVDKLEAVAVLWLTYRDPSAWLRLGEKTKHSAELFGWMIRFRRKEE